MNKKIKSAKILNIISLILLLICFILYIVFLHNKSTDNIKFWLIVSRETITNRFVKSIWKLWMMNYELWINVETQRVSEK